MIWIFFGCLCYSELPVIIAFMTTFMARFQYLSLTSLAIEFGLTSLVIGFRLAEFRCRFAVDNIKVVLCCSLVWKAGLELDYGSVPTLIKSSFYMCVS